MSQDTYNFNVKFDKSSHEIDTETYVQALSALTTIMKEVNYQLSSTERISVNVVAQDAGSFDVGIALKAVESMFSDGTVQYLAGITTILGGLIQLKKLGKKVDESKTEINGDDVTIKDIDGNVIYQTNKNTYNIYTTNQVVQDALAQNFRSLKNDNSITGFEINDDVVNIRVEKSDFEELSKHHEVAVQNKEEDIIPANLIIVKVVFEGKDRKWEFLYNGVKISASVQDDDFWTKINDGMQFGKGDELVADLKILREFDSTVDAYLNTDYQVINVREHHPRDFRRQLSLEDLDK